MKRLSALFVPVLALSLSQSGYADILMQWNKKPLPIALQVNQERIIFMDKPVRVGYQPELEGKIRIQSTDGAVYLKALAPFPATRFEFENPQTGEVVYFDIAAHNKINNPEEPVRVVTANTTDEKQIAQASPAAQDELSDETAQQKGPPAPIALVRYAAQSIYAPLRTVEPLEGVRKVAHHLPNKLTTLIPKYKGAVQATPLMSWQLDNYVVTAVRLQNRGIPRVTLDARDLQGRFFGASFQHSWLGGYGSTEDTTTLYLVTDGAVAHALVPEDKVYKKPKKIKKTTTIQRKKVTPKADQVMAGGLVTDTEPNMEVYDDESK